MLVDIFYFLLTLSILVTFHEYGHFWVARRCGVKVLRFSVGFGQPLWSRVGRDGTEYVIAAIPLGGYVKMLDEREESAPAEWLPMAFNRQSAWARSAIIAAGPIANFLLAIAVYWVVFVLGVPGYKPVVGDIAPGSVAEYAGLRQGQLIVAVDGREVSTQAQVSEQLLKRLGDTGAIRLEVEEENAGARYPLELAISQWLAGETSPNPYTALGFDYWYPTILPVIDTVVADSPAAEAGLQAGDRITAIGGEPVAQWRDVAELLQPAYGQRLGVEVQRQDQRVELSVLVGEHIDERGEKQGRIGISVQLPQMPEEMQLVERRGPVSALFKGFEKTVDVTLFTLDSIKKMLVGLISPTHLGGPVTIAKIASLSAESGLNSYLQMLALLSISLGIFNLLPIPVLDGGHLLIIAVQAVIRRPIPEKLLIWVQQVGLVLLLSIMVFAIYNDITRL